MLRILIILLLKNKNDSGNVANVSYVRLKEHINEPETWFCENLYTITRTYAVIIIGTHFIH